MQRFQILLRQWLQHLSRYAWSRVLLFLLGVFIPFFIFGKLAEEVWENDGGFSWDVPILLAIHQTARPQLDALAISLTNLGVFWGVFPVAVAIACYLFIKRFWIKLTYWLIALGGSIVINLTAKLLLHRDRPHLWISPAPEFDYGFPSGHAMSSMVFVAALLVLTWQTRWRWFLMIVGGGFVLAIGWTRLYLGVHYPSDILAGWTVSIAWAIGVSFLIKQHPDRHQKLSFTNGD